MPNFITNADSHYLQPLNCILLNCGHSFHSVLWLVVPLVVMSFDQQWRIPSSFLQQCAPSLSCALSLLSGLVPLAWSWRRLGEVSSQLDSSGLFFIACFTAHVNTLPGSIHSFSGSLWLQTKSLSCSRCSMQPFNVLVVSATHWPVVQYTSLIHDLSGFLRYSCFLLQRCQYFYKWSERSHLLWSVSLWFIFFCLITSATNVLQLPIIYTRRTQRPT